MPDYINLCIKTIKKTNKTFEIILLDDEKFKRISSIYNEKYEKIFPLGMTADYVRFYILKEFG